MRTKLNQLVGKMLGLIPVINCTILLALLIISSLSSAFPQTTHHSPLSSSSSPNLEGKVQEAHLHKITSRSIISGNINTNSNTNSNRQSKSMLFNSGPQPSFAADLIELHHKIATGRSLTLKCVVNDLGNHHVSWFHQEKRILLANDNKTINWRDRVHVSTQANTIFFLHIDNITLADQGHFACQVNTRPQLSLIHTLDVVQQPKIKEMETSIQIEPVREFDSVELRCVAEGVPKPTIKWRRESQTHMIPAYDDDDDGHDGGNENENEAYDETAAGRQQRQVAVVDMDGKINSTAATSSSSSSNVLESRQPVGDILIARPRTQVAPQLRLARDASRKVLPLRLTPPQETKTSTPALPLNPTPTTVDAAATLRRRARSDGRSEESRLQKKDHLLADFHSHSSTRSDSLQDQLAGSVTPADFSAYPSPQASHHHHSRWWWRRQQQQHQNNNYHHDDGDHQFKAIDESLHSSRRKKRSPLLNTSLTSSSSSLAHEANYSSTSAPRPPVYMAEGEVLRFDRVTRFDMGFYLCVASNGVEPSPTQRIFLPVIYQRPSTTSTTTTTTERPPASGWTTGGKNQATDSRGKGGNSTTTTTTIVNTNNRRPNSSSKSHGRFHKHTQFNHSSSYSLASATAASSPSSSSAFSAIYSIGRPKGLTIATITSTTILTYHLAPLAWHAFLILVSLVVVCTNYSRHLMYSH